MASPPRTREEERRLNARTLAIASAASATSAAVTSQLWIAGTWIAAAITPFIVAVVSELLHRPSERIARAITSDRPALQLDDSEETPATRPRPDPEAPERGTGGPASLPSGPVRVYRQPVRPVARPRLALGVIVATALIALAVAVAVLTVPELIAGQSLGKGDSATTFFSKSRKKKPSGPAEQTPVPAPKDTTTPSETSTTPSDETSTSTTPTETEPSATTTSPLPDSQP
jgi:hypothetical protein